MLRSDLDVEANAREGIGADWPIRWADIQPWYDYMERFAGISGEAPGPAHLPDGGVSAIRVGNSRTGVGMNKIVYAATVLLLAFATARFTTADPAGSTAGSWHALLQKDSAPDWRGWKEPGLPLGWHVADGVLFKNGDVDDLVSVRPYEDFELELQWKVGKIGNSGIFYRGTREYDSIYWSAPEYQLIDDANDPDGKSRLTAAGADYDLYPAPAGVVRPFDHWNRTRIVVKGTHVEHWLNGRKIVQYELNSVDWKSRVARSKFAAYPNYGQAKRGLIGLQGDEDGSVAIRRIRIRELP